MGLALLSLPTPSLAEHLAPGKAPALLHGTGDSPSYGAFHFCTFSQG